MNYDLFVIGLDVVWSRKIKNAISFQEKLFEICKEINKDYKNDIHAKFRPIKGIDELGAVLNSIEHIYEIFSKFNMKIYPEQIRMVVIQDSITSGVDSRDITLMAGPAIHKSGVIMGFLKKERNLFRIISGNKALDNLTTNSINLIMYLKNKRTPKQIKIIEEYEKVEKQYIVGKKMGISRHAVSYHLKKSNWRLVKFAEIRLKESLKYYTKICQENYEEEFVKL
jgi:hypothetical protein